MHNFLQSIYRQQTFRLNAIPYVRKTCTYVEGPWNHLPIVFPTVIISLILSTIIVWYKCAINIKSSTLKTKLRFWKKVLLNNLGFLCLRKTATISQPQFSLFWLHLVAFNFNIKYSNATTIKPFFFSLKNLDVWEFDFNLWSTNTDSTLRATFRRY